MNVAFFTDSYRPQVNGMVKHIDDVSKRMADLGHSVIIFAPGKKTFRIENMSKNLKIVRVPSVRFLQYEGYRIPKPMLKKISSIFERSNVDIIHAHSPFILGMMGLVMSKLYSIPIIGTYHTLLPEYFPHITKGKYYGIVKKIGEFPTQTYTKFIYSKFDRVVAPSNEIKRFLESCGIKRVVCIPNGIDIKCFECGKGSLNRVKKKYRIPKDKKILLYVGRVSFEKKLNVLLEALKLIEDQDVFLLVAGSGPSLEEYKKTAKALRLKNVRFVGYVKDELLPAVYRCSDIFVSPSDTETQGITFIEAMTCGLPVIGMRARGAKDVIKDWQNGLLVKPNDAVDMAIKISILVNNEGMVKSIGKRNRREAKQYSIEKSTQQLLHLYKKMRVKLGKPHPLFMAINWMLHPYKLTKPAVQKLFRRKTR